MISIHFDQFQRYKTAQTFINTLKDISKYESFNILEVGANEHKNLEKFCSNDKITYLDIEVPEELKNDPSYIEADATNLIGIEDDSYDIVIALDIFEHIPSDKRESFIKELNRVAKMGILIGAPFSTKGVPFAEVRGNEYYKLLKDVDHRWLKEHIDNGLPSLEETLNLINQMNMKSYVYSHGSLDIWEMMNTHLWKVEGLNLETEKIINQFYNEEIYELDISDENYRQFIFITNNSIVCKKIQFKIEKYKKVNKDKYLSKLNQLDRLIKGYDNLLSKKENLNIGIKEENEIPICTPKLPPIRKVYLDLGNGFSEENTIYFNYIPGQPAEINLKNFGMINNIRIDFSETKVLLKINSIELNWEDKNEKVDLNKVITNANFIINNVYFYLTTDSYLIFNEIDLSNIMSLTINVEILEEEF